MCVHASCNNSQLIACFKTHNIEKMMQFLHLISGTCAAQIVQKSLPSGKRKQKNYGQSPCSIV